MLLDLTTSTMPTLVWKPWEPMQNQNQVWTANRLAEKDGKSVAYASSATKFKKLGYFEGLAWPSFIFMMSSHKIGMPLLPPKIGTWVQVQVVNGSGNPRARIRRPPIFA
jgi:hypothetical protein